MNEPIATSFPLARSLISVSAPQHLFGFLMEQHFLIPPAARWCNSVEDRDEVHFISNRFLNPARSRRARMPCGFFHLTPLSYSPIPTTVAGDR